MPKFEVSLWDMNKGTEITRRQKIPLFYTKAPSLLSLVYAEDNSVWFEIREASQGIAYCFYKDSEPFWFNRLPNDVFAGDIVNIQFKKGQPLFLNVKFPK